MELLRKMMIRWTCPNCGVWNLDNYYETARPSCGNCGAGRYEWDEVLEQGDIERLEPIYTKYDKNQGGK